MPKHTFDDMVRIKRENKSSVAHPSQIVKDAPIPKTGSRRNIEDNPILNRPRIKVAEKSEPKPERTFVERNLKENTPRRHETTYTNDNIGRNDGNDTGSKHGMWFAALVSIIFLLFGITFLFARAKITIHPKVQTLALNENFTAVRGVATDDLTFDLVVISGEENKTLEGTSEQDVKRPAIGTVVLYNAFSQTSQTLDIDTRLEGSNGKIYKTDKRVVVPGVAKDGTPGSIEVGVHASEVGDGYNSAPLDFKVFGFKGTPKYAKFYGRSKSPLTGGYVGKMTIVSAEEKTTAVNEMKEALKAKLIKKTGDQIPEGFILFPDAVEFVVDEQSIDETSGTTEVPVKIKGTLYGFLFEEKELTKKIATVAEKEYADEPVYIPNLKDFTFVLGSSTTAFKDARNISFNLSGSSSLVYRVDGDMVASDTLGIKKRDFEKVLSKYENVDKASVVLRPFWKGTLPDKMKKIKVEVVYP